MLKETIFASDTTYSKLPLNCTFDNCSLEVYNTEEKKCLFHAQDKMGLSLEDFNKNFNHFLHFSNNCQGFIFHYPLKIDYNENTFGYVNFTDCVFNEDVLLKNFSIEGEWDFSYSHFKGHFSLIKVTLTAAYANLRLTGIIVDKNLSLSQIVIPENAASCIYCFYMSVRGELALVGMKQTRTGVIVVDGCTINKFRIEGNALRGLNIRNSKIETEFKINGSQLSGSKITNISLEKSAEFIIKDVKPLESTNFENHTILIENIVFNPYKTLFKNFMYSYDNKDPVLQFKYCDLSSSYFERCDFTNILLFSSKFEHAIFLDSTWGKIRRSVLQSIKMVQQDHYMCEHIKKLEEDQKVKVSGEEIANMYSQLKASYDSSKKFDQAGAFYLHEMELKRAINKRRKKIGSYIIQSIIWYFSGYSQKPFRSLGWALFIFVAFTIYNFLGGLKIFTQSNYLIKSVNYDLAWSLDFFSSTQFYEDFAQSLSFSFIKILPFNYYRQYELLVVPDGAPNINLVIGVVYSFIVLALIASTIIGIRRMVKRF